MTIQRRNLMTAFSFVGEFRFSKKLSYIVIANRIPKKFCTFVLKLFLLGKFQNRPYLNSEYDPCQEFFLKMVMDKYLDTPLQKNNNIFYFLLRKKLILKIFLRQILYDKHRISEFCVKYRSLDDLLCFHSVGVCTLTRTAQIKVWLLSSG